MAKSINIKNHERIQLLEQMQLWNPRWTDPIATHRQGIAHAATTIKPLLTRKNNKLYMKIRQTDSHCDNGKAAFELQYNKRNIIT